MNIPVPEVKELCQWEKQLYEEMSKPATFERMWNEVNSPSRECVVYDWPEGETA